MRATIERDAEHAIAGAILVVCGRNAGDVDGARDMILDYADDLDGDGCPAAAAKLRRRVEAAERAYDRLAATPIVVAGPRPFRGLR